MDDDVREFLDGRKPFMCGPKRNQYPAVSLRNAEKKAFPDANQKSALLHKLIICPLDGMVADHKNRNTKDFRRENLRLVTPLQNAWNAGKRSNNGLPKGVHKHGRKYRAKVCFNREPHLSAAFYTVEEASNAYDEMAKKLHGEYALLNQGAE